MPETYPHKVIVNSKNYLIVAPDRYENIKEQTGVSKVPDNDNTVFDGGRLNIGAAAAQGLIFRLDLTLDGGKQTYIYVAGDKVLSAPAGVVGKTVNNVKVKSARYKRRAVYH